MWTVIILIAVGILIVCAGAGLVVGLFKVFMKLFEQLFASLLKTVWGIIVLVLFFWALFKIFPNQ